MLRCVYEPPAGFVLALGLNKSSPHTYRNSKGCAGVDGAISRSLQVISYPLLGLFWGSSEALSAQPYSIAQDQSFGSNAFWITTRPEIGHEALDDLT